MASTKFVERRRYTGRDIWRDLIPLVAIAFAAWGFLADTPSVSDLRRVEVKDRDTQRATAYRLCTRNKVDRAFAHGRLRGINVKGEPPRIPGPVQLEQKTRVRLSRLLMEPEYLPILDCRPNLVGLGAKPLSVLAQEKFIRRWSRKQTVPAERGVCPRSVIGGAVRADRC
jgi:hypothetical protein